MQTRNKRSGRIAHAGTSGETREARFLARFRTKFKTNKPQGRKSVARGDRETEARGEVYLSRDDPRSLEFTHLLVDPLVHRRLPLLGPLDIEEPHEGFDGDALEMRARDTYTRAHVHTIAERGRS